nr:uncharacterized protein LOC111846540 isoform X2 [Paramormyrops kingsleyae]
MSGLARMISGSDLLWNTRMELIELIFVFANGILMCVSGGPYHEHPINLNCSSLRDGDSYRIRTEAVVGMNITLCDQAWSREEQNGSLPVGYYPKGDTDISPPVLDLTAQEIWMKECANLTLMLHCDQVHGYRFVVNLDDRQEEMTTRGFTGNLDDGQETTTHGFIAAVVVIGVFAVLLLVLAVRYRTGQSPSLHIHAW